MRTALSIGVGITDVAVFSCDVDLKPYGVLRAGSTGTVWQLDDDLLTLKLDRPVDGFGDMFSIMSDNGDVLASIRFSRARKPFRLRPPLRIAAIMLLGVLFWEAVMEPAVAIACHHVHCLDIDTMIDTITFY